MAVPFLTIVLVLVCCSTAGAATVRVEDRNPTSVGVDSVVVEDAVGETNVVSISYGYEPTSEGIPPAGRGDVVVQDEAASLQAGPGCEGRPDGSVRCQVQALEVIAASLGGGADQASAAPSGEVSCGCVSMSGGDGNDVLTIRDGGRLSGEDGDDVLRSDPSPAERSAHPLLELNDNSATGDDGDDVIETGDGRDSLTGGSGDDVLRAGDGDDHLSGYGGDPDEPVVDAGSDELNGGSGEDELDDGDDGFNNFAPPDISRDILIGGPDFDSVNSYYERRDRLVVDFADAGRDGAVGENDALINVEAVWAGEGNDRLFGDGDGNRLNAGGGENYVRGRGGHDLLIVEALGRQRVHGDRGDDRIQTRPWVRGQFSCGTGRDRVVYPGYGGDAPRYPDRKRDFGPELSGDCEAAAPGFGGVAVAPVPGLDGRTLRFGVKKPPRSRPRYLTVTSATKPFRRIGRVRIQKRRTAELRLPRRLAGRAHRRRGMLLRAAFEYPAAFANPQMVWRFRVQA